MKLTKQQIRMMELAGDKFIDEDGETLEVGKNLEEGARGGSGGTAAFIGKAKHDKLDPEFDSEDGDYDEGEHLGSEDDGEEGEHLGSYDDDDDMEDEGYEDDDDDEEPQMLLGATDDEREELVNWVLKNFPNGYPKE